MIGIDIFSGAGGMSLGAQAAGVTIREAVELDPWAALTYKTNHPDVKLENIDIRDYSPRREKRREPMVVFGGPPCQGFSTSNQRTRNSENQNNWLFREYVRIVKLLQPEWLVFENVKGITETEGGMFLERIQDELRRIGYELSVHILCAADFGVPQIRSRLFIVGSRDGARVTIQNPNTKPPTVQQAISDLPELEAGNNVSLMRYGKTAKSLYARNLRGELKESTNNLVSRNSAEVMRRYKYVPQGGNWENIPKRLMKSYFDPSRCHTGIYHRLKADQPSSVIGNYRKNMLIHPWADRGLSVREAARLQSFPDSFIFEGSIGFQQQQVGNAVPPLLAQAVFEAISEG
jgi:DNA (cytosine-5)-methyltransferase 1